MVYGVDEELGRSRARRAMTRPFASVIIPVFNDPERLAECLERLEAQTYPQDIYEVLVVDNGSTEPVDAVVSRFARVTLVIEPRGGQFTARNAGVARAKGAVLAFTDADCLPADDWLEQGIRALLETPNCAQVGGAVESYPRDPRSRTAVETYDIIRAFPQKLYVELEHYAVTANMFTFRWVYDLVGPFDGHMFSGGDNEWGKRLHDRGLLQVYCDTARVLHPARRSFAELYGKIRRTSIGHRYLSTLRSGDASSYSPVRFLYDLRLPVKDMFHAFRDPRLPGVKPKLQYVTVAAFVRFARAWSRLQLELHPRSIQGSKWMPHGNR
jgi:glycosyltransferase involved in cell wall biosynthesis